MRNYFHVVVVAVDGLDSSRSNICRKYKCLSKVPYNLNAHE